MKIWKPKPEPKPPCSPNGYLQRSYDKWAHFRRHPWAKVGGLFVPQPLRMSPGYPCCCGVSCAGCTGAPSEFEAIIDISPWTWSGKNCTECDSINDTFVLSFDESLSSDSCCAWRYTFTICSTLEIDLRLYYGCGFPTNILFQIWSPYGVWTYGGLLQGGFSGINCSTLSPISNAEISYGYGWSPALSDPSCVGMIP